MKRNKLLVLLSLLVVPTMALTSCNKDKKESDTSQPESVSESSKQEQISSESSKEVESFSEQPWEISERAMDNFLNKVKSESYVIDYVEYGTLDGSLVPSGGVKISVASDDLVYYEFPLKFDYYGNRYDGFAMMTVNERETFFGLLDENDISEITFVDEINAREVVSNGLASQYNTRLLDYFSTAFVDTIWELFTNDLENPLRFVSDNPIIKETVQIIASVGEINMQKMQDVVLEFDAEDPTEVHLKTSFEQGLTPIPDIDIKVTFEDVNVDSRIKGWMDNPNREYPEAKTEWGIDVFDLNSLFLCGDGEKAVPFPDFATYAFKIYEEAIIENDAIYIRDCKATEEGLNAYKEKLISKGFEPVDVNGDINYRLHLRDYKGFSSYSNIYLEYNEGVTLIATRYYNNESVEGLDNVNAKIQGKFLTLPASQSLEVASGLDATLEHVESLLYLFNYDLVFDVLLTFEDGESAKSYLEYYMNAIENGEEQFKRVIDNSNLHRYTDDTCRKTIDFLLFNKDLHIMFKYETYISSADVENMVKEMGFPEIDIDKYVTDSKDIKMFYKAFYNLEHKSATRVDLVFPSQNVLVAYLDNYTGALEKAGFEHISSDEARVPKKVAYYNEEKELVLCFDYDIELFTVELQFIELTESSKPHID